MGEIRSKKCEGRELTKDQLASWTQVGEASPDCAVGAGQCNTVNVSWNGPWLPCAGTKVCGALPAAHRTAFDLVTIAIKVQLIQFNSIQVLH